MNASIDIKTPAGQSLEGFPLKLNPLGTSLMEIVDSICDAGIEFRLKNMALHCLDTITITILP